MSKAGELSPLEPLMGISLRSCANSGSTKTRLSTRRRRWMHLQPVFWTGRQPGERCLKARCGGSQSKIAAARPKAPPPLMPAPCLPADAGPGPAPSVPPGQWGPCPDRNADTGPPTTSLRLPPNVQVLQQQHQQAGPSRSTPTPLPMTQQPGPGHPPVGAHGQNLVTIVYEGQSYTAPSAFVQS